MKKILLFIALGSLASLNVMAQLERSDTSQSLRGLNGVFLVCQMIDEHPPELTPNKIESIAASALKDAGIPINAAPKKFNGDANLSVTTDILKQSQLDIYTFTVEVAVTQDVRLTRGNDAKGMSAETWRRSIQGVTSPDRIDVIEQALKQCLNAFVTDYRAVNPSASH